MQKWNETQAQRDYLLKPTGFTKYGQLEYVYICKLDVDVVGMQAKGGFLHLIYIGDDENGKKNFDIIPGDNVYKDYFIKDGLGFRDEEGNPVHKVDENNATVMAPVQVGVYEANVFEEDGVTLKHAIGDPIMEDRPVELLTMFTNSIDMPLATVSDKTFGEALALSMFGTILKKLHGNNQPA